VTAPERRGRELSASGRKRGEAEREDKVRCWGVDSSETLGKVGIPHGQAMAKWIRPQTHQITRNCKSTVKSHLS
jgi:hypothetical protein